MDVDDAHVHGHRDGDCGDHCRGRGRVLCKKVLWTAAAWYHPSAYVSDSLHWSGDFEFVFTSSYYHSLILSFSLVLLFCRGRKRTTSAKRYFGWRRRDSIRPLKSRMFSSVYPLVDFECFLASDCYYHSLILSFSLVVLFRRGRKSRARWPVGLGTCRIFGKRATGSAGSVAGLGTSSPCIYPVSFLFEFLVSFPPSFHLGRNPLLPAQVSFLFGASPAGGVHLRAGGVLLR